MEKKDLRSLYAELQGYLKQAPTPKELYEVIYSDEICKQYNKCVQLIINNLGEDYNRFIIVPHESDIGPYINIHEYRQKLGGIIAKLHSEYFFSEPFLFGSQPNTIITQSQHQIQSLHIQMLLDIQSKIDAKVPDYKEGSKEKKFLQKIKNSLSSISDITQFLSQIFKIAKEFGLNIDDISKIFD